MDAKNATGRRAKSARLAGTAGVVALALCCGQAAARDRAFAPYVPDGRPMNVADYNRAADAMGTTRCDPRDCDRPPELLSGNAPQFPPEMLFSGIEGQATVVFVIGADGRPTDFEVDAASEPQFGQAAIEALQTWRFRPATLRDAPVPLRTRQAFPFELVDMPLRQP